METGNRNYSRVLRLFGEGTLGQRSPRFFPFLVDFFFLARAARHRAAKKPNVHATVANSANIWKSRAEQPTSTNP
jgi:hypothetical protein